MKMNTPEKIAQAYLRLNGFFTIPHFSVLKDLRTHIDFLAVRLGGSSEKVGAGSVQPILEIDNELLSKLGVGREETVGLVIEVKGGKYDHAEVTNNKFEYAKPFFGNIKDIKKVGFENKDIGEIQSRHDHIIISLKHCLEFIKTRFSELKTIEQDLKENEILSKEGSWDYSEEFLSDLIYLEKLKDWLQD